jgi:hypothetical protein
VYFFLKLVGILEESPRYVRRVRVVSPSRNTRRTPAQSRSVSTA